MDKKKFRQFIDSVAVVKDLKPVSSPTIRVDPDSESTVKVDGQWVEVTAKDNPTLGFKFVKLKPVERLCSLGCGEMVKDQLIEKKIHTYPRLHWRTSCKSCNHTVSPDGNGFLKDQGSIQAAFMSYYRKPIQEKEIDDSKPIIISNDEYTEIITNDSVIRKYK